MAVCCEEKVAFIITLLGSPAEAIQQAKKADILVFCDVTNLECAQKVEALGAIALIAVNKEAGGHSGKFSFQELSPLLKEYCSIPVISAGGVGNGQKASFSSTYKTVWCAGPFIEHVPSCTCETTSAETSGAIRAD